MSPPLRVAFALAASATLVETAPVADPLPAIPSLRQMSQRAAHDLAPVLPQCFAFSPTTHAFACFGHNPIYNTDHVGAGDQATNLRIDVVGPDLQAQWTIAAIGGRPTTGRRNASARLAKLGMRTLTTTPIILAPGRWTDVGAVKALLRDDTHESDVSFENLGDLSLRCTDNTELRLDLHGFGMVVGTTALAFRSGDPRWVAIGVVGLDGGEGTSRWTIDTIVIDLVTSCTRHSAAAWTTVRQG